MEILAIRAIASAKKYADTIVLKAGVRKVSLPDAYRAPDKARHTPHCILLQSTCDQG